MAKRLGEMLVEAGRLKQVDLERAVRAQQESGGLLGELLVRLGMISERDLGEQLAAQLELPLVRGKDYPEEPVLEDVLPVQFLKSAQVVPLAETPGNLVVATTKPQDLFLLSSLKLATGREIAVRLGLATEISDAIERLYGGERSSMGQIVEHLSDDDSPDAADIEHLKDLASEAPVVRLVNLIINRAIDSRASDIHIEPFSGQLTVRYRVDGVMQEVESPPSRLTAAIISRVKIMARLNIAERRLPQDGRIQLRIQGKEIDLRVSTVPTMHGESVVMRVLDKGGMSMNLEALAFSEHNFTTIQRVLAQPHGIFLVTGPTGSGKTTTLYAALTRLNTPERKILTVEDPVEYQIGGINQIQVKAAIGLNFARALRAIVRQDPDVIMIGEMRDLETAQIAIQSALTGHLVLSTLHTNDAASGVTRLLDMGVEDYLITSTVNCIMAQRLVRRLCDHCKTPYKVMPEVVQEMGVASLVPDASTLWHAGGCDECNHTGFHGRMGIHELLVVDDEVRRLVLAHATAGEIQKAALAAGMTTMYLDGAVKAFAGLTTIEEVLRVTQED